MFKYFISTLLFLCLNAFYSFAQNKDTTNLKQRFYGYVESIDLLLGYNNLSSFDNNSKSIHSYEIGIYRSNYHRPRCMLPMLMPSHGGSVEFIFNDKLINAYKYGVFATFLFVEAGIYTSVYTNYNNANIYLKPELGLAVAKVKITVGANIPIVTQIPTLKDNFMVINFSGLILLKALKKEWPRTIPVYM